MKASAKKYNAIVVVRYRHSCVMGTGIKGGEFLLAHTGTFDYSHAERAAPPLAETNVVLQSFFFFLPGAAE